MKKRNKQTTIQIKSIRQHEVYKNIYDEKTKSILYTSTDFVLKQLDTSALSHVAVDAFDPWYNL